MELTEGQASRLHKEIMLEPYNLSGVSNCLVVPCFGCVTEEGEADHKNCDFIEYV